MVALGALANAIGGGIYGYGFAVFFLPISRDLDLTRAEASFVFSLSQAQAAIGGPPAGWLVDRFGPRVVMTVATAITGIGYLLLSQADSYAMFIVVYLFLVSLAFNGGYGFSITSSVNSWFIRKRSLAFAITLAAFNVGGAVIAPVLALLVQSIGWRGAVACSGLVLLAVMLPASQGFVRSPEVMGMRPDGDSDVVARAAEALRPEPVFTVKQAMRTKSFWSLTFATSLRLAVINVVSLHFVPMMVWKGVSEPDAAFMLGAMAALGFPLRIFFGWLGDKLSKTAIISWGVFAGAAALVGLQFADQTWQLWLFVVVFAFMQAIIPLNWVLIGDYFGRRSYATLRGFMSIFYTIGTMGMPVFAGWVFDHTQSYTIVVWVTTGLFLASSLWFSGLKPPAHPNAPAPVPAAAPVG